MTIYFVSSCHPEAWRQTLSVENMLKPENIYKLNLSELAHRPEQVIREHQQESLGSEVFESKFNSDEYLLSSFCAYSQILKNAKPYVKNTKGYAELENAVRNMHTLAKDPNTKALLAAGAQALDEPQYFKTLNITKEDRTFGRGDSATYRNMKNSVAGIQDQIDILQREPKTAADLQALKEGRLADKLQIAADHTYEYWRSRSENGTKKNFSALSGELRIRESVSTLENIYRMQDRLNLRTTAQKLYEDSRVELLKHRNDANWMRQNGLETVSKMIHAKRCMDAKVAAEHQYLAFNPDNWQTEYNKLKSRREYMDFVNGKKLDDLVDSALENDKRFKKVTTAALIKRTND